MREDLCSGEGVVVDHVFLRGARGQHRQRDHQPRPVLADRAVHRDRYGAVGDRADDAGERLCARHQHALHEFFQAPELRDAAREAVDGDRDDVDIVGRRAPLARIAEIDNPTDAEGAQGAGPVWRQRIEGGRAHEPRPAGG